jgi:hypothetical protein
VRMLTTAMVKYHHKSDPCQRVSPTSEHSTLKRF